MLKLENSLEEDLGCFSDLALDFLHEDRPSQEELKVLNNPKVLLKMVLDEGKHRVLSYPMIYLVKLDDEESSFE